MHVDRKHLFDSAQFWGVIGGAVLVIGGIFTAIGAARTSSTESLWTTTPYFDIGIAAVVIGGFALLWAVVLFLAHRHALSHMCPDPAAHSAQHAPSTSSGNVFQPGATYIENYFGPDSPGVAPAELQGGTATSTAGDATVSGLHRPAASTSPAPAPQRDVPEPERGRSPSPRS